MDEYLPTLEEREKTQRVALELALPCAPNGDYPSTTAGVAQISPLIVNLLCAEYSYLDGPDADCDPELRALTDRRLFRTMGHMCRPGAARMPAAELRARLALLELLHEGWVPRQRLLRNLTGKMLTYLRSEANSRQRARPQEPAAAAGDAARARVRWALGADEDEGAATPGTCAGETSAQLCAALAMTLRAGADM